MNLDDLFGDGLVLGGDYLVKAQPRVKVRAARLPASQDLIDKLGELYDERLNLLMQDIVHILKGVDARKSLGLYVYDGGLSGEMSLVKSAPHEVQRIQIVDDLFKGPGAPKAPKTNISGQQRAKAGEAGSRQYQRKEMDQARAGSRGGKWYITASGKIRYGTKPTGEFTREAEQHEVAKHLSRFRPGPFMGIKGNDAELVSHIVENAEDYGLSDTDAKLLSMWYGRYNKKTQEWSGGQLFKDFQAMFKGSLTDEMLQDDLSKIRLNIDGQSMTYEEAVHEFMRNQFWAGDPDQSEEERHEFFAENVQPLLDDLFSSYEKLKDNPEVHKRLEAIGHKIEQDRYKFFFNASQHDDAMKDLADVLRNETDPTRMTSTAVTSMAALGLIFIPEEGAKQVGRGAAHLKGVVAPNSALLDDKDNPLLNERARLANLSNSQLMQLYIAAQLNESWDGEQRKYDMSSPFKSKLADEAIAILGRKVGGSLSIVKDQLFDTAKIIADQLNDANNGKNPLLKKFISKSNEIIGDEGAAEKIRGEMVDLEELRRKALEAQQNDKFDVPASMAEGKLGGAHQKTPLPHQQYTDEAGNKKTFGLFKHQRQSLNWMATVKRGVLALDAGMGKTPTIITFMEHLREQGKVKEGEPAILFLPPSLMAQWPNEIKDYAPDVKDEEILSLEGMTVAQRKEILKSDMVKKAKYIIISTGTLGGSGPKGGHNENGDFEEGENGTVEGGDADEMKELLKAIPGPVFIDEVHTGGFKEKDTVRHQFAKDVMDGREYAFGLTATPMPNGPIDTYHLANLFAPDKLGTDSEWAGATHGVQWNDNDAKWEVGNPEGLQQMRDMMRPFVFQKYITDPEVRADVGNLLGEKYEDPDLSKILPHADHPIYEHTKPGGTVDQLAIALYQRMVREAEESGDMERVDRLERGGGFIRGSLRDSLRRQAEISPELYDPSYKGGAPKIERMVQDVVKHFKGGGGTEDAPIVMFSSLPGKSFPLIKRELVKAGIDPSLIGEIHGGKSARERAFEQDMTNAGKRKILLVGTKSGGAGLNLQKKANRVMYLDQPLDPASKRQAVGRVWRPGQKKPVMESNYTMSSHHGESWDEKSRRRLGAKQALVAAMFSDVDLTTMDFTRAAEESLAQLGLKAEAQRPEQERQEVGKISPQVEALARKLSPHSFLDDPEDEETHERTSLEEMLDPKVQKKLFEEAKGLNTKMDVKEEQRVWDRAYDMNGMPQKWRAAQTLLAAAQTTQAKQEARGAVERLAQQSHGWYRQLATEAKAAIKSGDKETAKKLTAQMEKFRNGLPDAFRSYKDSKDAITAMEAEARGEKPPKKPTAGKETDTRTEKQVVKDAKEKAKKVDAKEKAKTEEKPVKGKAGEIKEFFGSAKNAATDGFINAMWNHVTSNKPIARMGALENKLRDAQKAGKLKTRADVEKLVNEHYGKTGASAGKQKPEAAQPKMGYKVAKKSPFDEDSHDHKLWSLLNKKQPQSEEEVHKIMGEFLTKLGVKKNEIEKWTKTMVKHFKKNGAL